MKVLLVEDDVAVASAIVRLTKALGHCVRHVSTVSAAQQAVAADSVDLVISDYDLRERSTGIDFLVWLGAAHPQVHRVLASGAFDPSQGLPDGVRFIEKPYGASELEALFAALGWPVAAG